MRNVDCRPVSPSGGLRYESLEPRLVLDAGPLVISELMADNEAGLADGDGDYTDWIEIHNPTDTAIDLAGWHLSDDDAELTKWRFPSVQLDANGYLVVRASNKDRAEPGGELHTNFKLSAGGEFLALVRPDGQSVAHQYAPEYPEQLEDVSYGVDASYDAISGVTASRPQYYTTPTPGGPNVDGTLGQVDDTKFSIDRGFFDEPFHLVITTDTPEATIRYTTNGSEPTETVGLDYTGPLSITSTTTLRAAAFQAGYQPSNVDTQTYVFLDDVIRQDEQATLDAGLPAMWDDVEPDYGLDPDVIGPGGEDLFDGVYAATIRDDLTAIPTLSLVLDVDEMFGERGIYSRPVARGAGWERATSAELIHPDGTKGFQVDAGIRIQGGVFRRHEMTKKHSLRLLFKDDYGPTKLEYPLFGADAVDRFDTVTLRSVGSDGWQASAALGQPQYARDEFARQLGLAMGQVESHGTFLHVYINGIYWGVYNAVERPDASFAASYFGGNKDRWDVINSEGSVVSGTDDAWNTMLAIAEEVASAPSEAARTAAYHRVQGLDADGTDNPELPSYLDVDNLIDYLIVNFYVGSQDWPINNYYVARRQGPESTGFKFFLWDTEWSLDFLTSTLQADRTSVEEGVAEPYAKLRASEEFRLRFADRVERHFSEGGAFYVGPNAAGSTTNAPATLYASITARIEDALVAESARWGDQHREIPYTRDAEWQSQRDSLLTNYFPNRSAIVLDQFRDAGLLPRLDAPKTNHPGGEVTEGFRLSLDTPKGAIYYTLDGSDPRETGGSVAARAQVFNGTPIRLDTSVTLKARTRLDGEWSALLETDFLIDRSNVIGKLAVTEVNYNPYDPTPAELAVDGTLGNDDFEFIELRNTSSTTIELEGVRFTDGVTFDFSDGSVETLGPGEHLVVVADSSAFAARYGGDGIRIAGVYDGRLKNGGERVTLLDRFDQIVVDFQYDDSGAWPGRADGEGSSLELLDPSGDPGDPENWRSSTEFGGSPGAEGDGRATGVVISEIMYHPASDNPREEFIELLNRGSKSVDLTGWRIDKGVDFTFPAVTLDAGAYLVLAADTATFARSYPNVVNVVGGWTKQLSDSGETIELVNPEGGRVDRVRYADEGDWAVRQRGPLDFNHRGWVWSAEHDGGGTSVELINPAISNNLGQNWASSGPQGGTPGARNSAARTNIAPLIGDVSHFPAVPRSSDPVTVTAEIRDERTDGMTAAVAYRVDGTATFSTLAMADDGLHGDGAANDGVYGAVLPAAPDGTVIELFVRAIDSAGNTRTWPAATQDNGQATNLLYQVDDTLDLIGSMWPGAEPTYLLVMTEAERAELADIGDGGNNEERTNAQMNGTFISIDESGTRVRYNTGIRNRGHGSRFGPPNNYRVNFTHDRPYRGVTRININYRYPYSQVVGSAIFQAAGLIAPDATSVQVRVGGVDLAVSDRLMHGSYVHVEVADSDFLDNHLPEDSGGNLYKALRTDTNPRREADLSYEGPNPDAYRDTYFKNTNATEDDWSDLIHMTDVLNNSPAAGYVEAVEQVIDLDQWLRYLALDALLLNTETGLNLGIGDDYLL
ncbi:MAG: lamin tail domain-containing protein, partial [Thermoguttaceae bacterium]